MEQKIRIKLTSCRYELADKLVRSLFEDSLFGEDADESGAIDGSETEHLFDVPGDPVEEDSIEVTMEGVFRRKGDLCEIRYEETELTGMAGSVTSISFRADRSGLVSMTRSGTVKTALVFEARKRHICLYNTPAMPFEVCVCSHRVDNRLLTEGRLELDYAVEIRGAQAERTRFTMEISPIDPSSEPLERPEVMIRVDNEAIM